MTRTTMTYNPGFLTDDELRATFCVRVPELESLIETLRENTGDSNQHVIVIGPRGSGKTTLLLRTALEVRSDPELSSRLYPIVFAEESYSVSTCGEFWLECLTRLAERHPHRAGESDLRRTVEDVRREADDRVLRERCLAALLYFADRTGKRLVLLTENLDMLFSGIMDPDAGWCLRKTLQTEPQIMMIGSATSRFGEIDRPDRALYDLFRILTLRPLNRHESAVLCERVSGSAPEDGVVRRLQILTGGSPRLMAIVARLGVERSFRALMSDLLDLVDEHTAYFKGHLESLPAQERRVYLALAELWRPATAREVAERARIATSKCSAQLRRLIGRGVVSNAGGTARKKRYYVSERLYNIYYLLRRSRGLDGLVGALVQFMAAYYSRSELREVVDAMVAELGTVDSGTRLIYGVALERFSGLPHLAEHFYQKHRDYVPDEVKETTEAAATMLERAGARFESGDLPGALSVLERLLERFGTNGVYDQLIGEFPCDLANPLAPLVATALFNRANMVRQVDGEEAGLAAYDELDARCGASDSADVLVPVATGLVNKAVTLFNLQRWDEALAACQDVWERFGNHQSARVLEPAWRSMTIKSAILSVQGRTSEHLLACDELLDRLDVHDRRASRGGATDYDPGAALPLRLATHEIRVLTNIKEGQLEPVTDDLEAIVTILPQLPTIPPRSIRTLLAASVALGADRMTTLIRESPSASQLLPLTTALELEMGREPRVAIEVAEVADDIRRDLDKIRRSL